MHDIQKITKKIILNRLEEHFAKASDSVVNQDEDTECLTERRPKAFLDLLMKCMYDGIDDCNIPRVIECLREKNERESEENTLIKSVVKNLSIRLKYFFDSSIEKCDESEEGDVKRVINQVDQINNQLRDEVITIMIGGQETTSCENSFALLMLAWHPDIQTKVAAEVDAVFEEDDRPPSYEDLQKLGYLKCVINETMRLFPSLPVISRSVEENTTLTDNSILPKGSSVSYFIFGIHRDPLNYENPNKFDPDRFLPENARKRHPNCFLPFSLGPRNCIGQRYAMLQMKTILSTLIRKFKFLPSDKMTNFDDIQLQWSTTLKSKTGIWVKIEPRKRA